MSVEPRSNGVPTRAELPVEYTWRLEDIYENDEAWETDFARLKELIAGAGRFEGKLGESAQILVEALEMETEIHKLLERIAGYALMRQDEDTQVGTYQAMAQRVYSIASQAGSALSYLTPEILALGEERIEAYLAEEEALAVYRHALEDLLRGRNHVLSPREEQILAEVRELTHGAESAFDMLNHADMRFGTIVDEDGNEVELTHSRYIQFQRSYDRRVRQSSFEKLYAQYSAHKNTLAAIFNTSIKSDVFYARQRKFGSALEAALHPDNVPVEVYDNLIGAVRDHLPVLHRYLRLKRRALHLDELHMYDLYVPLVRNVSYTVPYDEALRVVKEGLFPLGDAYQDGLEKAFTSRWIDVFENQGKLSGAYQRDVYGVHPYILLNYHSNIDDVFTLAHELGHALHSHFSMKHQPYVYADYSIFVAEVASTVNEALLVHYLLDSESDPRRRLFVLNYYLEQFRTTVFRQTMFAEFEKIVHASAEKGEALTADALCAMYRQLNVDYYGAEVHVDEPIDMEWARIPHFYRAFYVYKYATGFSAANALAQAILSGDPAARERYLNFLKSGGSDYPLNLLKEAGVDMSSPEPVSQALAMFDQLLDEVEVLVAQHVKGE